MALLSFDLNLRDPSFRFWFFFWPLDGVLSTSQFLSLCLTALGMRVGLLHPKCCMRVCDFLPKVWLPEECCVDPVEPLPQQEPTSPSDGRAAAASCTGASAAS